jgi:hypothetical protein
MYNLVNDWKWGNSGDPKMYHDVETRKNSISYRGNMARLVEVLINEGKFDKAEKITDLAIEKMPIDIFGYYTFVEPFVGAYYEIGKKEKGRLIFEKVSSKYQENLTYYSSISELNKSKFVQVIYSDIEKYKSLVDTISYYENEEFVKMEMEKFNFFLKLFTKNQEIELDEID